MPRSTVGSCASNTGALAKNRLPYGWTTITSERPTLAGGSVSRTRPSSSNTIRFISRLFDSWTTYSKIANATPTSTANCSGISIVSANVMAMTVDWSTPVFATDWIRAGLIAANPTTMRRPASAGIAT